MVARQSNSAELAQYQRELALVDQVIALQAQLAREATKNSPDRFRIAELEIENEALRKSMTWRIGSLVLTPVRVVARRGKR